ncbi:MAG: exodeoxyribonuclease III [Planctomycetota bacterium]
MRIATWNLNGIRAAARKGLADRLAELDCDVWLYQEVRATPEQLDEAWSEPDGYHALWHPAEKLGYAGTALWSRAEPKRVQRGLPDEHDLEGRVLQATVGGVRLVSVYLPSGSSGEHRQVEKERWMERFMPWAEKLARSRVPTILGGDLNIAHTERDIFHAKSNQKTSGFLPHERAWFGDLLETGWADLIRESAGDVHGPYSWWSNRGRARELDRGWRIDYLLANRAAAKRVTSCGIDREAGLAISDHAPVWVELD